MTLIVLVALRDITLTPARLDLALLLLIQKFVTATKVMGER